MRPLPRLFLLSAVPLFAGLAHRVAPQEPVDLVGDAPHGVLHFEITDADGQPMPGRLTFLGTIGPFAELFSVTDAAPHELAVRKTVVYSLSGRGAITVPAGQYAVVASRGLEWSMDATTLEMDAGAEASWTARLTHEVDTRGWVSGDFHLHTYTHSGHGDSNMEERIISLVGEGVEFAVATDHNHNTDYGPTIETLGAGARLSAVTGNEVSTSIGHFNAFPLDPERPVVDHGLTDAGELFALLRAEENELGVRPIIQLNHPRWDGIDYFALTGLDPVTATSADSAYSDDFDSIEVLNENAGWGYHDPVTGGVDTLGNLHSVLQDWFHLLDRGHRYAAVGNSDSHNVHYNFAGYPRNFLRSPTDDPAAIDPRHVARAIRTGRLFTTLGPFVQVRANGVEMGGDAAAVEGEVRLELHVQAASWVDCDRVKVIVNGDLVETVEVPAERVPLRLQTTIDVCLRPRCEEHPAGAGAGAAGPIDAWLVVLVEGDDPIQPIVHGRHRPIRPVAISNPIWIDGDGDGTWTSPWDRAVAACTSRDTALFAGALSGPPAHRARVMGAMDALPEQLFLSALLDGLVDPDRRVRLAALRAAERSAQPVMRVALEQAWERTQDDPYAAIAALRAFAACQDSQLSARLVTAIERFGSDVLGRYSAELEPLLRGPWILDWRVLGYFDAPEPGAVTSIRGPEVEPDPKKTWTGRGEAEIAWRELAADPETGILDLTALAGEGESSENALVYAETWLYAPVARSVPVALGTDDGCRVYLNSVMFYENLSRRAVDPLEHVTVLELQEGWNRLVFVVENGGDGFGLVCRLLAEGVRTAARPE